MGRIPYVHGKAQVEPVKGSGIVKVEQELNHKLFSGTPGPTAAFINKPGQVIGTEILFSETEDISLLQTFVVHHREDTGDLVERLGECHGFTSPD